ncbi:glycosyl transferase family 1 [Roseibium aquae]|uniref:Glycosyl transferase family 1 n=1 Tax=Roseibium aquae TaxID=1323746 RepID=A0A916WZR2_9HYPH|nr:glycosyltransferase family 4 protein [Roseibium aquae]GGB46171.1 glycosyl transferase family 1 [Roseibium aquae]
MADLVFAYPGDLETPTGGYIYDRRIIEGLRQLGVTVDPLPLGEGFPFPGAITCETAAQLLMGLIEGQRAVIDGLAFGAMHAHAARIARCLDLTALIHHPLYLETGLSAAQARAFKDQERVSVQAAARVIVTSPATANQVCRDFGVHPDRVSVVVPGVDKPALPVPAGLRANTPFQLLSVGTLTRRKGFDLLFSALKDLTDLDWHLDIVGDDTRDSAYAAQLIRQISETQLTDRVTFHGAVSPSDLWEHYTKADAFVLASRYEGYGMAYIEAIAHGLPVIGSGGGAVRETLPPDAAIYCGQENVDAIKSALRRVISDPELRHTMANAARQRAQALPDWGASASRFADAVFGHAGPHLKSGDKI